MFVDQGSASAVDQFGVWLHFRQFGRADHVTSLVRERRVERETVDNPKQFIERTYGLDHPSHNFRFAYEWVKRQDVHLKRQSPLRDGTTDASQAHDA